MAEALPVPLGAQPPNVIIEAIAKAAAELAAQEAGRRQGIALDRDAVQEVVDDAIDKAFKRIGVDLADHKSIAAFNLTISHAESSRGLWSQAGAKIFEHIVSAVATLILGAVAAYVTIRGVK